MLERSYGLTLVRGRGRRERKRREGGRRRGRREGGERGEEGGGGGRRKRERKEGRGRDGERGARGRRGGRGRVSRERRASREREIIEREKERHTHALPYAPPPGVMILTTSPFATSTSFLPPRFTLFPSLLMSMFSPLFAAPPPSRPGGSVDTIVMSNRIYIK